MKDKEREGMPCGAGVELSDDLLDAAAGGASRKNEEPKETCVRCSNKKPRSQVLGGYCLECRAELAKKGIFPSL